MFWFNNKIKDSSSESNKKLKLILQNLDRVVFVLNKNREISEVSNRVEKIFGIKKSDIIGKTFAEQQFLNQKSDKNKIFLSALEKKENTELQIDAHDPYQNKIALEALVRYLDDIQIIILENPISIDAKNQKEFGLDYLSNASSKLLEMMPEKEIYQFVANQLVALVPDSYVFISRQDSPTEITSVASATSSKFFERGIKIVGGYSLGKTYTINDKAKFTLIRGNISKVSGGIHELTFGQIPKSVAKVAELATGIKSIFSLGLFWKNKLFGAVTIVTRKNSEQPENAEIIETLVNLAAVAIQRRKIENQFEQTIKALDTEKNKVIREKVKDEAVLESIGDGLVVVDNEEKIISMNNAAGELLGINVSNCIGKKYNQILIAKKENGEEIKQSDRQIQVALKTGKKSSVGLSSNYYYSRKDNTQFPIAAVVTPVILDNKIIGVIDVFRDISREQQIDKAKTEFVSLASHQLRTPLSAINWYTEMLMHGDAGKINEKQKDFLDEVYTSSQRMVSLVKSLLNVSRLELGTFVIDPKMVDLPEIAKSVIHEMEPLTTKKKIKIEEKYQKLEKISADPELARMIFQNLISNAVKYSNDNGRIIVEIENEEDKKLKEKYPKGSIIIKVSDNGLGIPKSAQSQIFTKLFRADNVKSKEVEGTGLGLYIIKSIVDHSGGEIWFASEENKNTTFFIRLPKTGMPKKTGSKKIT